MDTTPEPREQPEPGQGEPLSSDDLPHVDVDIDIQSAAPEADLPNSELRDEIDSIRAIGEDR